MVSEVASGGRGLWRFQDLLPPTEHRITLGEAGTPLISCADLAERIGVAELLVKNETVNPTLSFKDRAMALGVSLAQDVGARGVVAASTGNTAVSAAAYAARAHLEARIFCGTDAARQARTKLSSASTYGATVETVGGDYSSAHEAASALEADGWMPLTTTFRNPYLTEAYRTVAFELYEQTGGQIPEWIVIPVGAGPLLVGLFHGFRALAATNTIATIPRLVAVQADACAPLVTAWTHNGPIEPVDPGPTVASAIADPLRGYEDEGRLTLEAIQDSRGLATSVSDSEILEAVRAIAHREGLLLESAAAAPIAAITTLIGNSTISSNARVAVLATGHGAVEPHPQKAGAS